MLSEQPSVSFLAELPLGYALSPPQHIILSLEHSYRGTIKRKSILTVKMFINRPGIYVYIFFWAMVSTMGWGSFRHFLLWYLLFLVALIRKETRSGTGTDPLHNLKPSTLPGLHSGVPEGWNIPVYPWSSLQTHHIACKKLFRINHLSSFASCCYIHLFRDGLLENFTLALPTCKVPCPNGKLSLQPANWYSEV